MRGALAETAALADLQPQRFDGVGVDGGQRIIALQLARAQRQVVEIQLRRNHRDMIQLAELAHQRIVQLDGFDGIAGAAIVHPAASAVIGLGVDGDIGQFAGRGHGVNVALIDADAQRHHDHDGRGADHRADHGQDRAGFAPPEVRKRQADQISPFHRHPPSPSCACARRRLRR